MLLTRYNARTARRWPGVGVAEESAASNSAAGLPDPLASSTPDETSTLKTSSTQLDDAR